MNIFSGLSAADFGSVNGFLKIFANILALALWIAGIVAVVFIIVGGIRYIMSAGNDKAVVDAKNTIMWAILGLIVAITAGSIVTLIVQNLGGTAS